MKPDVLVLGAGMIGTCTALQLALRGHSVALLDRREPGRETSYGNAGLIQCEAVEPYPFPQDPAMLLRVALKRGADVNYHLGAMPSLASPLGQYWANSRGERYQQIAIELLEGVGATVQQAGGSSRHLASRAVPPLLPPPR